MSKLTNIEAKKIVALSFIILFCVINISWVPLPLRISVYILTTSLSVLSSGAVFSFYNNIPDTQHSLLTTGQYIAEALVQIIARLLVVRFESCPHRVINIKYDTYCSNV